jgi:hypothetical protein
MVSRADNFDGHFGHWGIGAGEIMDQKDNLGEGIQAHETPGAIDQHASKASRIKGAKAPKASKPQSARRPLKLSLPLDVIGKLQLHAIQEGISVSALVSRLAREHCNEWTIHRTPTRA